jgi:CubicO group peptidase (beta-lactamase class C family)
VAALALAAPSGWAQQPKRPEAANLLAWSPEQQSAGYRAMEDYFEVTTIKRGDKVHPLPPAGRTIDVAYPSGGKTWTTAAYMAAYYVSGVLVLKDGKILMERYGMGRTPQDRWTSFSVAKSVTATLVGAAIADGKIRSLAAPVTDYLPELKGSGYDGVTVRQLLMMSSGVKWNEDYTDLKSDVAQAGFSDIEPGVNPLLAYLRRLPPAAPPGTKFNYNTAETDLAGILVANAVGKPLAQYLSEKIWIPYGMERDGIWATDLSGKMERAGCCISMTLRDYGRVGQFILDGGVAAGKRVVAKGWVAEATKKQVENGYGGYGYFWWIRPDGGYDADGVFGQSISTFRSERLVIVINSAWPQATGDELYAARTAFLTAVRASAK